MYLFRDTDFMIPEMSCKILDRKENNNCNNKKKKWEFVWKWLRACKLLRQEHAALLRIFFSPSAFECFTLA